MTCVCGLGWLVRRAFVVVNGETENQEHMQQTPAGFRKGYLTLFRTEAWARRGLLHDRWLPRPRDEVLRGSWKFSK